MSQYPFNLLHEVGSAEEQRLRGNAIAMQTRFRIEHIIFGPIGIEGHGVPSTGFESLINRVSKTAFELRDYKSIAFGNKCALKFLFALPRPALKCRLLGVWRPKFIVGDLFDG